MNALINAITLIVAVSFPLMVFAGVPNELVFGQMYFSLSIKAPSIVLQHNRKPGPVLHSKQITWITESLDTPGGSKRFHKLLVECILDLKRCGRIDLQNTWETHMVTKKNSAARSRSNSDQQSVDLRDRIYKLCLNEDYLEVDHDHRGWMERRMMELADVKPTLSTVELAFDFVGFSMLWRSYRISFSVAFQMAVFQHARVLPEEKLATLKRFGANDPRYLQVIGAFYGSPVHKKEISSYDAHSFHKAIRAILLKPYQFEKFDSPTIINFMIEASGQEFFILSELVKLCQEVGPSMIQQPERFWKQLEAASVHDDIQPLMKMYHKACQYFKNGIPLDKNFEYYELVASILIELKELKKTEAEKVRIADRLSEVKPNQQSAVNNQIDLKNPDETIVQEKVERMIRDKVNLAMNYAEEYRSEPRKKASRGGFRPTPRASSGQLQEIALLFRDLLTPRSVVEALDEVEHKISQGVTNAHLPAVIINKVSAFAVIVQHEITTQVSKKDPAADPSRPSPSRFGMFWSSKLSDAFGKALEEDQLSTDDALLSEKPSLQNNQEIWNGMKSTIEREFWAMNSANAEILIDCLKRVETDILMREISNRISRVMRKANDTEKKNAIGWVQERLDELQASPAQFIKLKEFDKLKEVLNLIKKHSKKGSSTAIWEQRISPKISELHKDLAMMLDEIIADLPDPFVADKLLERLDREVKPYVTGEWYSDMKAVILGDDVPGKSELHKLLLQELLRSFEKYGSSVLVKHLQRLEE
ncbi:hypothetical protein MJO28_009384 [Puccinia striiformis f. sp. tritici]|uniref:Uncharacterized protein n=1 Tax=Puccinia striiformis f. sp. tritici TaxID=168172 RepID=A0ACC0E6Y6_9BASI|nr:hypothetical protein MJO28_009384 [Puccinia striiformis f. sp. tritici]